jgi:molybdopterin synthase catalytic subunit
MPRLRVLRFTGRDISEEEVYTAASKASDIAAGLGLGEDYAVVCSGKVLDPQDEVPPDTTCYVLVPRPGVLVARVVTPEESVSLDKLVQAMALRATVLGGGAVVGFTGFVKGYVDGNRVDKLVYDAYRELADRKLYELAAKYADVPGVIDVAVLHYIGERRPGDYTIHILVSAKTRHEAFHTAALLLEEVKHKAPIFKLEERSDGTYWVLGDGVRVKKSDS